MQWFVWWRRRGVAQLYGVLWFCSVSVWGSVSALTCGCVAIRGSWPFLRVHVFGFQSSDHFLRVLRVFCLGCLVVFLLPQMYGESTEGMFYHTAGVVERDWTSYMVMEFLCRSTVSSRRCPILLPMLSVRLWCVLGYLPFVWFGGCTGIEVLPFHAGSVLEQIGNIDTSVSASVLHPALRMPKRNGTDVRN